MEAIEGTEVRAKTLRREATVDCRGWLEFEISEILMGKIRYTYRVQDKTCKTLEESVQLPASSKSR